MRHLVASVLFCSAMLFVQAQGQQVSPATAQSGPAMRGAEAPQLTPEILAAISEFERFLEETPDPVGTGVFPAEKLTDPAFPDHVIYQPQDLSTVSAAGLGILLWGNGGCMYDGASGRMHLLEVASHGYLAIAPGPINSGPGAPPKDERISRRTTWQEVVAGLDQAIAANSDPSHPLYGKLDLSKVAVAGHSCGGMQSLSVVLNDPRIRTAILHNSGLFRSDMFNGGPVPPGLEVIPKTELAEITVPLFYILGGPSDIAYLNGIDDYGYITNAPVMVASIDLGHQGSFNQINGGVVAQVAVDWLEWQLRGDREAQGQFVGGDCGLCRDTQWTVQQKGLE